MLAERQTSRISINTEMCKACDGYCCKRGPCQYLPIDFDNIEGIIDEIEKNIAIIDYAKRMYGKECYFLRVRTETEDLTSPKLLLPKDNIYLATLESRRKYNCKFYKWMKKSYFGIEYDNYDEEKIRSLTEKELYELFERKILWDQMENKILTMEENIQEYLESKAEFGWGGCLLSPEQRPGGALYAIPNYHDGMDDCIGPAELYSDNWDKPEHQEKLIKILKIKNIIKG